MVFGTGSPGTSARWAALALGCALVAGGCSGDGNGPADDPAGTAEEQAETAAPEEDAQDEQEEQDEQPATEQDDAQEEQAAADEPAGDCAVDAATVNEIVDVGVEIAFDDVNELANDGVSCIYTGENDGLEVIVSVSAGTWDGTDERVEAVVAQTEEYYGEPAATPDLGDQAFLFDSDFGGSSLVVFVDGRQYSIGIGGAGFDGTPLESLDTRQSMATELYEQASG